MMRFLVAVSFTDDNFGKLMGGLDNELGLGNEVRKRTKRQPFFVFAVLYYRTNQHLPRQARDKRREDSKIGRFLADSGCADG
jgi:hypothetical protein